MDTYFTNQTLRIRVSFTDEAGDPADPTALVYSQRIDQAAVITKTYGVDPEVKRESIGIYYIDVLLATVGTYVYQFIGTGTIENAIEDSFAVITALDTVPLVELAEAKDYLNIVHTDDNAMIQGLLLAIEAVIRVYLKSTIEVTEKTHYFDGNVKYILLPNVPVDTSEGVDFTVHDDVYDEELTDTDMYRLVAATGQLYYNNEAQTWPVGMKRWRITYSGGLAARDDYAFIIYRLKVAELTWLSDFYYNRKASNTWEKFDDIEERKELERLPLRIEVLLTGLLDVSNDF